MLGSPFPPAVYIGHPGWKAVGGRIGYSLATGVAIALVCFLGLTALLLALIPLVAILPILLYIGLVIGAQAFQATPTKHAPAVVLALIPNIAEWAKTQIDGALAAAGTSAAQVGLAKLAGTGVLYHGLESLGGGSVLAGMVLGAIAVFIIDSQLRHAAALGVRRRDPRVRRADPRRAARLGSVADGRAGLRDVRRDLPSAGPRAITQRDSFLRRTAAHWRGVAALPPGWGGGAAPPPPGPALANHRVECGQKRTCGGDDTTGRLPR